MFSIAKYLNISNNVIAIIPKNKDGKLGENLNKINIKCYYLKYGTSVYDNSSNKFILLFNFVICFCKLIISLFSLKKIKGIILRENIEMIYTNTSVNYLGAISSKCFNIPHVWHIREFGMFDQNWKRLFGRLFFNFLVRTSFLIFISKDLQKYYKKNYNIFDNKVIYNDIDFSYTITRVQKNIKSIKNVLIAGRISIEKGQSLAIQAIINLINKGYNINLFIAGKDNSYSNELKKDINEKYFKNINFLGFVESPKKLWNDMDIVLICSRREAFGRTVIEGMLSYTLVIGCDTGAIPELVKNMETGLIYEYNNIQQLVISLEFVLNEKNMNKLKNILDKAYDYSKRFNSNYSSKEIEQLMKKNIKKNENN